MAKEVTLDFDRRNRTGLAEAVMCINKSVYQLQSILDELQKKKTSMLFTRLGEELCSQLAISSGALDYDEVSRTAFYFSEDIIPRAKPTVCQIAVVTGGSSDIPVAREAIRTLAFYGVPAEEVNDIGVAGLWRLEEKLEFLRDKKVIICVAGMDAALPTVIGGLVPGLIIAVPSSIGYGMAHAGETALNSLLCSCAQGLVVVNIDNGFGAACAAIRVLNSQI